MTEIIIAIAVLCLYGMLIAVQCENFIAIPLEMIGVAIILIVIGGREREPSDDSTLHIAD